MYIPSFIITICRNARSSLPQNVDVTKAHDENKIGYIGSQPSKSEWNATTKSPEKNSNTKGPGNKLDEILHRTKRERYIRGKHHRTRGRLPLSTKHNPGKLSEGDSNAFLSDIIAAQAKTSKLGKTECTSKDYEILRQQMHQYEGEKNIMFAEIGKAEADYKLPVEGTNVDYSLWKLAKKADPNEIKKAERNPLSIDSLSVLIRTSFHGVRLETNPQNTNIPQFYTVDCKLENQATFGAEQVSQSELAKQWIATMLRPNSKLARLRVNSSDASVLMAEIKSLKDLTLDGAKENVGFKPDEALGNVYTLFSELTQLPNPTEKENGVARYLLQHDLKSGAFVKILKAAEAISENSQVPNPNLYDAHMPYNIRSNEDAALPPPNTRWMPIDVDLITPYHRMYNKVPGLFTPKSQNFMSPTNGTHCGPKCQGKHQHKRSGGRGKRGRGRRGSRL